MKRKVQFKLKSRRRQRCTPALISRRSQTATLQMPSAQDICRAKPERLRYQYVMKYQLVLQFPADSRSDEDAAAALEEELEEVLGEMADVDGHNAGETQTNLFLLTADPAATFKMVKPVLHRHEQLEWVTVAYREQHGDNYIVLWPEDWTQRFTME